jgi:hypothetical protein
MQLCDVGKHHQHIFLRTLAHRVKDNDGCGVDCGGSATRSDEPFAETLAKAGAKTQGIKETTSPLIPPLTPQ